MDGIAELAKMFKERDNVAYMGPQVGKVISPPPDLKVSLGKEILLTREHLVVAAHVLAGYERALEIPLTDDVTGETQPELIGDPHQHTHQMGSIGIKGRIKFTNTLKAGDEVILIPTTDCQRYFLVDKIAGL